MMGTQLRRLAAEGQAATECVLLCSFILVPLFLIVPIIGKYIDIKHAAIAQSRYEVWEYTAWFDEKDPDDSGDNITTPHAGVKNLEPTHTKPLPQTRVEGFKYFFGDPHSSAYATVSANHLNPLWVDHRGASLFTNDLAQNDSAPPEEKDTPDPTSGFVNELLTGINDVTSIFGDLLHTVGVDATFDALNTHGYFVSDFTVSLKSIEQLFPADSNAASDPLLMHSQASVLARGWNSSSSENAHAEAQGLVIAAILEPVSDLFNSLTNRLEDIVAKVNRIVGSIFPIHLDFELPHMPIFGYMDEDLAIPAEHLQGSQQKLKHESGLYFYGEGEGK